MTDYNKKMVKILGFVFLIFAIFWLGINIGVVFKVYEIKCDDMDTFVSQKYQNCIKVLGMIVPIMYGLVFYYIFMLRDEYIIIRYGRRNYEKKETKKILILSIIFASEYMAVDLIFSTVFIKVNVLLQTGFYIFVLLKFIMLVFYLNLIGETLFFVRNLLDFSPVYVILGTAVYVFLSMLYYIMFEKISPVFYMDFSEEWFLDKMFDTFSYIINIAKMFLSSLILMYLGQIVFLKRDIIGNEEV